MRRIAVALSGVLVSGCYTLQPVINGHLPPLGSAIALDINDAGRVVLGGTMGPEIGQIEGRLVQKDSVEYVLSVSSVRFLRGGEQTWAGERIHIKNDFVSSVQQKQFSRGRTAAISAVALGVVAIIVTRSLIGSGQGIPANPPTDTTAQKTRIPWH